MVHYGKLNYIKVDNVGRAFNDNFDEEGYIRQIGMYGERIGSDDCDCAIGGIAGNLFVGY